jgi:hypothetical protein
MSATTPAVVATVMLDGASMPAPQWQISPATRRRQQRAWVGMGVLILTLTCAIVSIAILLAAEHARSSSSTSSLSTDDTKVSLINNTELIEDLKREIQRLRDLLSMANHTRY